MDALVAALKAWINARLNELGGTLSRIGNQLGDVNTTVNLIRGTQTTQDTTIGLINTTVTEIHENGVPVDLDPVLNAVQAVRQDLADPHLPTIEDVLTAIAGLDLASILEAIANLSIQVGNLPIPPSAVDISAQVWLQPPFEGEDLPWNHVTYLERFARNVGGLAAFVLKEDPFLTVETSWKYPPD
jgi:hypothetical protein